MEIRKLENEEHQKSRQLYEEVFTEDSRSFVDYYYTEKIKDNQIYVAEEAGQIRAMLHLNPYCLCVNGSEKDTHYIVAVATKKEYRKRGYMAALMKQSLRDMYQAGETFTFLMPASEDIYLPFGFRTVYEQERRFYWETGNVPEIESNSGIRTGNVSEMESDSGIKTGIASQIEPQIKIQDAVPEDCRELAEFANAQLAEHYQVFVIRDETYYQRLLKEYESDGGCLKIYRKDGEIIDCMLWYPQEDEDSPKIMVRIVDVRRMLMSLSLHSLMGACFQITDPIIEENNRCVLITGTEFSGVMLMEGKPENSEGTITVAALASLVFGAKTVEEVCREEGTWMSERMQKEMEKIIPLSAIYLNEAV